MSSALCWQPAPGTIKEIERPEKKKKSEKFVKVLETIVFLDELCLGNADCAFPGDVPASCKNGRYRPQL